MGYLSFSGYKVTQACDYMYWHQYVNYTVKPEPEDRLGSIFGSSVGRIFEDFYSKCIWKKGSDTKAAMLDMAEDVVDQVIHEEINGTDKKQPGIIVWKDNVTNPQGLYYNKAELVADVKAAVERGLETIKKNKFLGQDVEAELYLNTQIGDHTFGGRADFVFTRFRYKDLVILDGKGSIHRERYLDPTQLLWYQLLLHEKFGKWADWTGFLHWKSEPVHAPNQDFKDVSTANVDRYVWTKQQAEDLKEEVISILDHYEEAKKDIPPQGQPVHLDVIRAAFPPIADQKGVTQEQKEEACKFCPYAISGVCDGGVAVKQKIEERLANRK